MLIISYFLGISIKIFNQPILSCYNSNSIYFHCGFLQKFPKTGSLPSRVRTASIAAVQAAADILTLFLAVPILKRMLKVVNETEAFYLAEQAGQH